jgi:hypothetical protein
VAVFEKDWIQRVLRQLAIFFARLLRLKEAGEYGRALQELRGAYGELLGLPWDVLGAVDAPTAAALLGDPERVKVLARLVAEEADLLALGGDPVAAEQASAEARRLHEAAIAAGASPDPVA